MEERVPVGDGNDDPMLKPWSTGKPPLPSIKLVKSAKTYVIQIPRDQVYRIPPAENASIAERYRNPRNDGKNACVGRWILMLLAIILVGCGIFFAIDNFSNPKSPEFSIIHFSRKVLKSSSHSAHDSSEYEISLHVFNPNKKMDVNYGVGNVTLNLEAHKIAYGESKLVQQDGGSSIVVHQSLRGTQGTLPDSVEKSMNDKHPKVLSLKFDVPVQVKTWRKTFKKELIAGCDLKVDSFGQRAKLLSQTCGTNYG